MKRWAALVAVVLLAACSGGGSSSPTTTTAAVVTTTAITSQPEITLPSTTVLASTTTTIPPAPPLPAGMQFTLPGLPVPLVPSDAVIDGDSWALASTIENGIIPCDEPSTCISPQLNPVVYFGNPTGGFEPVTVDDITSVSTPAGAPVARWLSPSGLDHSALGWAMVGTGYFSDPKNHELAKRAFIWYSADGATWTRVDLRNIVGDQTTVLYDVIATDTAMIAVGAVAGADLTGTSRGLVLRSTDGVNWTAVEIPATYSTDLSHVELLGESIVVRGDEYICTTNSSGLIDFNVGGQDRAWRSDDAGGTFAPVDLTASQVYAVESPPPADPAACEGIDFNTMAEFQARAGSMRVAGDRLFLFAPDGLSVASTTDLTTWTKANLPGATSAGAETVQAVADGFTIVHLERPGRNGHAFQFGTQAMGWRTDPTAGTWTPIDTVPPVLAIGPAYLYSATDGSVVMFEQVTAQDGSVSSQAFVSTSGPFVAPLPCTFEPAAKCGLTTITGENLAGKNLAGIDLTGATITDTDFTGADLTGAILSSAAISGGTFTGAKLVNSDMRDSDMRAANLTGADLSGANLTGATADLSLFVGVTLTGATIGATFYPDVDVAPPAGITFAGLNLTGASFDNFSTPLIALAGTDWTGTVLNRTLFFGLDLSGANFTGADMRNALFGAGTTLLGAITTGANIGSAGDGVVIEGTSFGDGVVCPDGQGPTTPGLATFNQCRFVL